MKQTEIIHLNRVVCAAGDEEKLKARLREVQEKTINSADCLEYRWHTSSEKDANGNPIFYCYVRWENRQAFEEHLQSPQYLNFMEQEKTDATIIGHPTNINLQVI